MSAQLRDLAATRLAALGLNRRGRPRSLTFDDHVVRGGLILDLALCGALVHTEDAVEMDHARALSGKLGAPPSWVLAGLGEAQWAAELVVDRLTELRAQMRTNGHDLDAPVISDPGQGERGGVAGSVPAPGTRR